MGYIKFFILGAFSLILVVFCAANRGAVSVSLFPLPYLIDIPVFIFALLCVAVGVTIGGVFLNIKLLQVKMSLKHSKRRAEAAENENKILRSEREHVQHLLIAQK